MAWTKLPHPGKAFSFDGEALGKHWARLHRGDSEPLPGNARLRDAWRKYHSGDFEKAMDIGLACGLPGYAVANKATVVYASYLETDVKRRRELLLATASRCEEHQRATPGCANAWYLHAYALGRYSQSISVVKALSEGLAGKIRSSLEQTLSLDPKHADAHIALGTYHAEIIDKVGALVGGLSYGVSKSACVEHFETALRLNGDSAIARIEFANALMMIFGKSKLKEAERLYQEAAESTPADAMEWLDVELAKSEQES